MLTLCFAAQEGEVINPVLLWGGGEARGGEPAHPGLPHGKKWRSWVLNQSVPEAKGTLSIAGGVHEVGAPDVNPPASLSGGVTLDRSLYP